VRINLVAAGREAMVFSGAAAGDYQPGQLG